MERRRKLIATGQIDETAYAIFGGLSHSSVKNGICGFVFFSVFFLASVSHADQFNDLYYIDPGGVPDLTEEGKQNELGGVGSGGGGSGSQGGSSSGGSNGSSSSGGVGGSPGGGSQGGGGGSQSGGAEGGGETEPEVEDYTEEEILETLLNEGSISGGLGGVEGGVFSGGGGGIVVNGSRVRSFLRKDPDIDEVLRYWKIGKGKKRPDGKTSKDRLTPGEYYALIAATIAADDERFEQVRFNASDFEVTYRSRGALFAFIPWSFPVRVNVVPHAAHERVTVGFPWYHWFVREYFTREGLSQEIDIALNAIIAGAEEGEDMQGELLDAVTQLLRQKVQTITNSILLK